MGVLLECKRHAERHWIISDNYHNSESYDKYEVF